MIASSLMKHSQNRLARRFLIPAAGLIAGSVCAGVFAAQDAPEVPPGMVLITDGSYTPMYSKEAKPRAVEGFFIDVTQVTNGQFLEFVKEHPAWQRSRVERTLADESYLTHWRGDLDPGDSSLLNAPVTYVSWFAAKAYCEAQGKRLPTQDEWELVGLADATRVDAGQDQAFLRQLLEWYSKPATSALENVNEASLNVYGIRGLHGLVWEWVDDFNSSMVIGDSRGDGSLERDMFCGAGALLASDVSNYAAFMRYAFRSSLQGTYCVGSLGFRGVKSLREESVLGTGSFTTVYDLPGTWKTQSDEPVKLDHLRGKVRVISMGFTRCEYACPRIFADMQRIETALGPDADRVGFTFFSIDPANDTPTAMTAKMKELKMKDSRWSFLSSTPATTQQLAVALNFKFQAVEDFFAHSNLIAVLDAEGKVVHREESLGADIGPSVKAIQALLNP